MKTSGCIHDGWLVLSPKKEVSADFFYHLLGSPDVYKEFERRAAGVTVKNLNIELVSGVEVPLPPLEEQRRIAEVLDRTDALRQKRRLAIQKLDVLLQSVFLDMFGDPVTNPKGWEVRTLSTLAKDSFRNGLSASSTGTVGGEVLMLSAITGGRFKFSERKAVFFDKAPSPLQMVSTDTFLICRGNGNKRLVGAGAYPDRSSDRVCFPDTMIGINVEPELLTAPFLQHVWASNHVRRQIEIGARTTNGTHKVNQQTLGAIAFPVPCVPEQERFARIAVLIQTQRAKHDHHLAELDALFASLQFRAFRGEL